MFNISKHVIRFRYLLKLTTKPVIQTIAVEKSKTSMGWPCRHEALTANGFYSILVTYLRCIAVLGVSKPHDHGLPTSSLGTYQFLVFVLQDLNPRSTRPPYPPTVVNLCLQYKLCMPHIAHPVYMSDPSDMV